jgi:4-amino-4-deoxy-L-arabinose transferase-like glycosyltransferase
MSCFSGVAPLKKLSARFPRAFLHMRIHKYLLLVLLLGFFLRVPFLSKVPVKVSNDEMAKGYDAYSLIKTGKTFKGLTWPVYFTGFADAQPSYVIVHPYLVVLATYIFGPTLFAVRLPAAILGVGTVLVIYYLAQELFSTRKIALLAALLLAISPWHIYLSRVGVEPVSYGFFFSLAWLCCLRALRNPKLLFPGFALLGLVLYTYQSAMLVVPFFIVLYLWLYRGVWSKKLPLVFGAAASFVLVSSTFINGFLTNPYMLGHYRDEALFPSLLGLSGVFGAIKRFGSILLTLWVVYTLPLYFLAVSAPFLKKVRDRFPLKSRELVQVCLLFFVSFVPAAMTKGTFYGTTYRSSPVIVPLTLLSALGLSAVLHAKFLRNLYLIPVAGIIVIHSIATFFYAVEYDGTMAMRPKLDVVMSEVDRLKGDYDNVVFVQPPEPIFIYVLFYLRYDPAKYLNVDKTIIPDSESAYSYEHVVHFDNFHFCSPKYCDIPVAHNLYVVWYPAMDESIYKALKTIYYRGVPKYVIAERIVSGD